MGSLVAVTRPVRLGLGGLLDADEVARRIAHGAVAQAVRLIRRLLHDLDVGGCEPLEGGIHVGGREV